MNKDKLSLPLPASVARSTPHHSKSFLSRLDESTFWEAYVGATLSRMGLYVTHQPMDLKQDRKDFEDCATSFDLEVSMDGLFGKRIEVKSMRRFEPEKGTDLVFVCSLSNFRKKFVTGVLNRDFLMVDKSDGSIHWLPIHGPIQFSERYDSSRDELFRTVVAHKGCFRSLDAFLNGIKDEKDI